MKYFNIFDVVELKNGNKATILSNEKNIIKVEEVDNKGISKGIIEIKEEDIRNIIFKKLD